MYTSGYRYDLVDLRLLVNVAEASSLTHGAEASNLSVGAASSRITALEKNLDLQIFERNSRGMTLTSAGETLCHHVRIVLNQLQRMSVDLQRVAKEARGSIRIASSMIAISNVLPGILQTFLPKFPNISVHLRRCGGDEGIEAVINGNADVAIVTRAAEQFEKYLGDDSIAISIFASDTLVLLADTAHPLSTRRQVSVGDILDYELIGIGEGAGNHPELSKSARQCNKHAKFRIHVSSYDEVCRLVAEGVAAAIVPASNAGRWAGNPALVSIPITDAWTQRKLAICYRKDPSVPDHVLALVAQVTGAAPTVETGEICLQPAHPLS